MRTRDADSGMPRILNASPITDNGICGQIQIFDLLLYLYS